MARKPHLFLCIALSLSLAFAPASLSYADEPAAAEPEAPTAVEPREGNSVEVGDFALSFTNRAGEPVEGTDYVADGGDKVLKLVGTDPYTVAMKAGAGKNTDWVIKVEPAAAAPLEITLDKTQIDVSGSEGKCALLISGNSDVKIRYIGQNEQEKTELKSGKDCAGIQKENGTAKLTITGASPSEKLYVYGGEGGAGIGGGANGSVSNIEITGNAVTATGGAGAAGIGGGEGGSAEGLSIVSANTLKATGGAGGAGIGGGSGGYGKDITVYTGYSETEKGSGLEATGMDGGAGIGGGANGAGSFITIEGDYGIKATGKVDTTNQPVSDSGAGIGGGSKGIGSEITIIGKSVELALGEGGGAGIGGGAGASAEKITISGSVTLAKAGSSGGAGIGGGSGQTATDVVIEKRASVTAESAGGSALINGSGSTSSDASNLIARPDAGYVFAGFVINTGGVDTPITLTNESNSESFRLSTYADPYFKIDYRGNGGAFVLKTDDGRELEASEYAYSANDGLTITGSGAYVVSMADSVPQSSHPLVVASKQGCTVTIEDININCSNGVAMSIAKEAGDVTISLSGKNKLQSSDTFAGLQKEGSSNLTITGPPTASLDVTGGAGAAGIGGNRFESAQNITITGGNIKVSGNKPIGAGNGGTTNNISIAPQAGMHVNVMGKTDSSDKKEHPVITNATSAQDLAALYNDPNFNYRYLDIAFSWSQYELTVSNGTDLTNGSPYLPGTEVKIKADPAPEGKIFDRWVSSAGHFSDASQIETTFTMPPQTASVTAVYRDLVYETRTLADPTTGVSVVAEFAENAELVVVEASLHEPGACEACDAIRTVRDKGQLAALWDISISGGYKGKPIVSIPVDASFEGKTATVLHDADCMLESVASSVSGARVEATLNSLSPVAVSVDATTPVPGKPGSKTLPSAGDTPALPSAAALASLSALALIATALRRRRAE